MRNFSLPGKYILVLIIIFALLPFINLFYSVSAAPSGYIYGFGQEEVGYFAAINSYKWDYKNPYGNGSISYFENPVLGSIYILVLMGFLAQLSMLDVVIMYELLKFIFLILYMIVVYNVISLFVTDEKKKLIVFLFYMIVSSGAGGLLYIFFKTPVETISQNAFQHLFWSGGLSVTGAVYRTMALFFGYSALVIFHKRTDTKSLIFSAIFIGLSILSYPTFGGVFLLIIFLNSLFHKKFKEFIKMVPIIILFAFPWLSILNTPYKSLYLYNEYTNIFALIILLSFLLPFALISIYTSIKSKYSSHLFLVSWIILITLLLLLPKESPINSQRLIHMTFLPWSIAAFLGMEKLKIRENYKIYISVILIILSLPTFIFWYADLYSVSGPYFPQKDIEAMKFLKSQPQGIVLAVPSRGLSSRIPYLAEKQSLRGGGLTFESIPSMVPVVEDHNMFYSENTTKEERVSILKRNNIQYLVIGVDYPILIENGRPRKLRGGTNVEFESYEKEKHLNPEEISELKKIYDTNNIQIYVFDIAT